MRRHLPPEELLDKLQDTISCALDQLEEAQDLVWDMDAPCEAHAYRGRLDDASRLLLECDEELGEVLEMLKKGAEP